MTANCALFFPLATRASSYMLSPPLSFFVVSVFFSLSEKSFLPGRLLVFSYSGVPQRLTQLMLKGVLCLALQQPQEVLDRASKPYCLNPPGSAHGPDPPDSWKAQWVAASREWALPSLMQFINSPNVRKSAALLKYGECCPRSLHPLIMVFEECPCKSIALLSAC
jgi:hypothetical protein